MSHKKQKNITHTDSSSYGLRAQSKLGQYDFPFTLNPTTGCFFGCKYCYSPNVVYSYDPNRRELFFENVEIKLDKAAHVRKELKRYANLPQHLKRVQINETSEYYLRQVLDYQKKQGRGDVMLSILEEFGQAWNKGNKWMLHILTKSPLILLHLPQLKLMKEMVQIEVSFATHDDAVRKKIECFTPSTQERLDLVGELTSQGLFVRIMAMPFYGDATDLQILKDQTFQRGAKAFKNKGLNYYKEWDDLTASKNYAEYIGTKVPTGKGRLDQKDLAYIIKSGEHVMVNGTIATAKVIMPQMDKDYRADANWATLKNIKNGLVGVDMPVIDSGYAACNNENWGYIR